MKSPDLHQQARSSHINTIDMTPVDMNAPLPRTADAYPPYAFDGDQVHDDAAEDNDTDDEDINYSEHTSAETRQLIADDDDIKSSAHVVIRPSERRHRTTAGHGRPRRFQSYSGAGTAAARQLRHHQRSASKLYSPLTVFTLTIVFLLFLYIPLFNTFHESSGMYPISGWELNTTRDTTYYVLPQYNTTLIDPVRVCNDRLFLLMVVCSSAANFDIRNSIRQTWANTSEFNYAYFRKAHARLRNQYLDINYPHWINYTTSFRSDPVQQEHFIASTTSTASNVTSSRSSVAVSTDAALGLRRRPQFADFRIKVVFLVGQTVSNETQSRIVAESDKFGDMIQESFLDSYNNLTLKTIMMLKWVTVNCGDRVQFLMKCDDDTFVNVPNLLHILLGGTMPAYNATIQMFDQNTIKTRLARNRLRTDRGDLLLGSRFCNSKPISNTNSKWYTPVYMYSGTIYPNYLSGTGYVMSMDVAHRLYNASLATPIFHLEDVYLTGICAEAAHIRPINHPLFSYTSYRDPCELRGMITRHQLTAVDMRRAYELLTDERANCTKPDRYFHVRKVKSSAVHSCT